MCLWLIQNESFLVIQYEWPLNYRHQINLIAEVSIDYPLQQLLLQVVWLRFMWGEVLLIKMMITCALLSIWFLWVLDGVLLSNGVVGVVCAVDLIGVSGEVGLLLFERRLHVKHDLSYCLLQVWLACCVTYQFKIDINQLLTFIPLEPEQLILRQTLLQRLTYLLQYENWGIVFNKPLNLTHWKLLQIRL